MPLLRLISTEFLECDLKPVNDDMTAGLLTSKNVLPKEDLVKLEQWDKTVLTKTLNRLDDTVSDEVCSILD